MTITEFLIARIAEDESRNGCDGDGEYWTCVQRSERIEAECEAKRQIVGEHGRKVVHIPHAPDDCVCGKSTWPCTAPTLRFLASIYANHPDYREEWA